MRLILRAVTFAVLSASLAAAETAATHVTITADQMCAVTVDGGETLRVTKKEPQTVPLAAGEHVVAATCSGGTDKQTITVTDKAQTVVIKAVPSSPAAEAAPRPSPTASGSRKKSKKS